MKSQNGLPPPGLAVFLICVLVGGVADVFGTETYDVTIRETLEGVEYPLANSGATTNRYISKWRSLTGTARVSETKTGRRITWSHVSLNCSVQPDLQVLVRTDGPQALIQKVFAGTTQDFQTDLTNVLSPVVITLNSAGRISRVSGLEPNTALPGGELIRNIVSLWVVLNQTTGREQVDPTQRASLDSLLLPMPIDLQLTAERPESAGAYRLYGGLAWTNRWTQMPCQPGSPNVSIRIDRASIDAEGGLMWDSKHGRGNSLKLTLSGSALQRVVSDIHRPRYDRHSESSVEVTAYKMHLEIERR